MDEFKRRVLGEYMPDPIYKSLKSCYLKQSRSKVNSFTPSAILRNAIESMNRGDDRCEVLIAVLDSMSEAIEHLHNLAVKNQQMQTTFNIIPMNPTADTEGEG